MLWEELGFYRNRAKVESRIEWKVLYENFGNMLNVVVSGHWSEHQAILLVLIKGKSDTDSEWEGFDFI